MTAPAAREPQMPDICPGCDERIDQHMDVGASQTPGYRLLTCRTPAWRELMRREQIEMPSEPRSEIDEAEAGLRQALTPAVTVALGLWGAVILVLWVAFG